MYGRDRDRDTICAVSTPHGVGGISVIRISGSDALKITQKIANFLPVKPESHRAFFGLLRSQEQQENIDEVVATYFAHGKSFTGDETIEISCHGSPTICQRILGELILAGARPADRGEFTYRAFMNGRMDLVQAESVLALIESQSKESAKQALRQLKGDLSDSLAQIEDNLTWCLAHIEASIDFSTEGIELVSSSDLIERLDKAKSSLTKLVDSYSEGRLLREGLHLVLFGRPNVGKSSLLNFFLQEERAIVTNVPGTTRDVVHGEIIYGGVKFVFLDTAGLRETTDMVEKIGVEKSRQAIADADRALYVFDASAGITSEDLINLEGFEPSKSYILVNKMDLLLPGQAFDRDKLASLRKFFKDLNDFNEFIKTRVFFVSAIDKKGRDEVLSATAGELIKTQHENSVLISNARQAECLRRAQSNVGEAKNLISSGAGAELLAIELKEALIAVQETLGKRFDDQVMDRVFKEFCIGK